MISTITTNSGQAFLAYSGDALVGMKRRGSQLQIIRVTFDLVIGYGLTSSSKT